MNIKTIQSFTHFHLPPLIVSSKGKRRWNLNTQKRMNNNNNKSSNNNSSDNNKSRSRIQLTSMYDPELEVM